MGRWAHAYIYILLVQLSLKDRVWRGFLGGGTRQHTDPKDEGKSEAREETKDGNRDKRYIEGEEG